MTAKWIKLSATVLLLLFVFSFQGLRADEKEVQVQVGAFGDLDYNLTGTSQSFPSQNDFTVGDAALAVKGRYGDHLRLIDENLIEFSGSEIKVGIDRLIVTYIFSDQFRLTGGRDHLAIGYWNRTYNYAAELQPTIERPFFFKFEDDGGVVPVHIAGLTADGIFDLGGSSLKYEFNLGNSEKMLLTGDGNGNIAGAELTSNASGDPSSSKTVAGRLVFKPWIDGGLALGIASAFNRYDTLPQTPDLSANPLLFSGLGQVILECELIYTDDNFDLLSEFYEFDDRVAGMATQGSSNNQAFYVQLDYLVAENVRPYLRLENLTADADDPFFQAMLQQNETLFLAGLRLDIEPKVSCLKLEGRVIEQSPGPDAVEAQAQWAFGF